MDRSHLITTKDLSRTTIDTILDHARTIAANPSDYHNKHPNTLLGLLFYEPSTRTRLSFETAMKRLGGDTIDLGPIHDSSVEKGESLADTVRVVEGYADALVLRHPREGAVTMANDYLDIPLINGGDGAGHHPSQTLLDLYTIQQTTGLDDLTIGILGDLKYGRTVHSLAYALTQYDATQHFISPPSLQLPDSIRQDLHNTNSTIREHTNLDPFLPNLDVLYVTRIQRERFPNETEYQEVAGEYQLTPEMLTDAADDLTILHPLPRVDEIAPSVDDTPYAQYFTQAHNGVPVRMALLDLLLSTGGETA